MLFNKNHNYLQAITAPIFFSFPLVLLLWIGNEMRGWRRYSFASGALALSSNKRYISMDWLKSCLIFSSTSKIDQNCLVELKGQAEQRPWIVILTCFIACFTRIFLKEAWPWKLAFRGLLHPLKGNVENSILFFFTKVVALDFWMTLNWCILWIAGFSSGFSYKNMSKWHNLSESELTVPEKEYFQEKSKVGMCEMANGHFCFVGWY